MCGPQFRFCLFTFRFIASKHLNNLTTIDTLSWLGGAVVTLPLLVHEVPGSMPGSDKGLYVWFFCFAGVAFLLFVKNTLFVTQFCNSFCNFNLFSIPYILQDFWLLTIMRTEMLFYVFIFWFLKVIKYLKIKQLLMESMPLCNETIILVLWQNRLIVYCFWTSGIVDCMLFTFEK